MQNHLEILSKYQFWTRNVRNLSKLSYGKLTESLRFFKTCPGGPTSPYVGTWLGTARLRAYVRKSHTRLVGNRPQGRLAAQSSSSWAQKGPYGPFWAHDDDDWAARRPWGRLPTKRVWLLRTYARKRAVPSQVPTYGLVGPPGQVLKKRKLSVNFP